MNLIENQQVTGRLLAAPVGRGVGECCCGVVELRSGGGIEGDPVAAGSDLAGVVAFGPVAAEAVVIEVGADVVGA